MRRYARMRVGARDFANEDPMVVIADPDCPAELWWELAAKYPFEAMKSVLYPLLTLEDPERWAAMERQHALGWLRVAMDQLPIDKEPFFMADCAEHVLPFFTRDYPKDKRVQKAVEMRRRYARGEVSKAQWFTAAEAAERASRKGGEDSAAWSAAWSAVADTAEDACEEARCAAARASGGLSSGRDAETRWQWGQIQRYLPIKTSKIGSMAKVGARRPNTILKDPKASEAELRALLAKYPQAVLENPNCPTELWWELAADFPLEAMESVLYPLLTLEEPDRWIALERDCLTTWVTTLNAKLPAQAGHLFSADCIEHVVLATQKRHHGDARLREAIRLRRAYAHGQATKDELWRASQAAAKAFPIFSAACYSHEPNVTIAASNAIAMASNGSREKFRAVQFKEKQWQWQRLLWYLRQGSR